MKKKELERFNAGHMEFIHIPMCNKCKYSEFPGICTKDQERELVNELNECELYEEKSDREF